MYSRIPKSMETAAVYLSVPPPKAERLKAQKICCQGAKFSLMALRGSRVLSTFPGFRACAPKVRFGLRFPTYGE